MFLETLITEINYENFAKKFTISFTSKNIGQSSKHFIRKKNPTNSTSFDRQYVRNQTKAIIFDKFFTEQCTPLKNSSILPVNQMFLTQTTLYILTKMKFSK